MLHEDNQMNPTYKTKIGGGVGRGCLCIKSKKLLNVGSVT